MIEGMPLLSLSCSIIDIPGIYLLLSAKGEVVNVASPYQNKWVEKKGGILFDNFRDFNFFSKNY